MRDELFPMIKKEHAIMIAKTDFDGRFNVYTFNQKARQRRGCVRQHDLRIRLSRGIKHASFYKVARLLYP